MYIKDKLFLLNIGFFGAHDCDYIRLHPNVFLTHWRYISPIIIIIIITVIIIIFSITVRFCEVNENNTRSRASLSLAARHKGEKQQRCVALWRIFHPPTDSFPPRQQQQQQQ